MAYADYAYYTTVYLGNAISEADFPRLAQRAGECIDQLTFGRAADATGDLQTAVKDACCAVAEAVQRNEAMQETAGVSSEKVGDLSVSYTQLSAREANRRINIAATQYLARTGLLYPGAVVMC